MSSATSGQATVLIVNRDKLHAPFEPEMMQLAQRLLPHLRNVYALQQHLQPLEGVAAGWDFLRFGVWLLDRDGRVAHANTEARRLARVAAAGLSERDRELVPNWRPDRPAFQKALTIATNRDSGRDTELLLHDTTGRAWAACNIRPLHHDAFGCRAFSTPCTAILFVRPLVQCPSSADALRHVFGLTPAETDLACALLQHGALADCGPAMNKQRETLRTHLKGLFAKTETHRQSELIRRLQAAAD
ncbi:MAG: helix-turn-helix transcriptional regulator [Xanthomonadaceae bacterium]|nr:helix-turn-helix transcriptional regulator [Xanthomonadaceae bacterium]MDZ4377084.1 helix-turn-helix transcriptional regulator [Xanthomonadaceae bacterium]